MMRSTLALLSFIALVSSAGAFQAVDSAGRVIGDTFGGTAAPIPGGDGEPSTAVLRRTDTGVVVSLRMARDAIAPTAATNALFYESADCTGDPQMMVTQLVRPSACPASNNTEQFSSQCYYPADPIQTKTLASVKGINGPVICAAPGCTPPDAQGICCCPTGMSYGNMPLPAGPAALMDMSVFTPPFSVQ